MVQSLSVTFRNIARSRVPLTTAGALAILTFSGCDVENTPELDSFGVQNPSCVILCNSTYRTNTREGSS